MIEIVFPFRLPGINEYTSACRRNAYTGAKMKKEAQEKCEWIIRQFLCRHRDWIVNEPCRLEYTFTEPNKKRDLDNIAGFAHKIIQDALAAQGVLSGDGWGQISGFTDSFQCVKGKEEIRVRISDLKEIK